VDEERRFSDKEVEALLARAVDITRRGGSPARREGMALSELERVAAEAGLPGDALRRALAELEAEKALGGGSWRRLLGLEVLQKNIDLAKAPNDKELERLLMILPDLAGWSGSGAVVDSCLVWRSDKAMETQNGLSMRVEAAPKPGGEGGTATVKITATSAAGGIYGGLVGGMGLGCGLGVGLGVGLGELHSALFATLVPIASLALSFALSRGIMAAIAAWARKKITLISEVLERRLGARS
jgi:hypothetical protein